MPMSPFLVVTMIRLPASSLRTFVKAPVIASTSRRISVVPNSHRNLSNGLVEVMQKHSTSTRFQKPLSLSMGARSFTTEKSFVEQASPFSWRRFATTAAGVAGAIVVLNTALNRETRDSLSMAERELLNDTFKYTGGGLALTAIAARSLFQSGVAFKIMSANPWAVLGLGLVGSIGTMMGAIYTPPENSAQKHLFWLAFNGCQAATLSPLFFFSPAILSRAAFYTIGIVGSISYVGATAKTDKYLNLGAPLLAGVTAVALSSLAPMVFPMGLRALAVTEAISLYGGLAVFGGFVLFDTQKILQHGRLAQQGLMAPDPIKESISLELDMINIFIRLVQILAMRSDRK